MKNLVSTNWLLINLNNPNLVILDCTWYLPSENINGNKVYLKEHLPSSHYFDIEKISDMKSKLPHMLPSAKMFEKKIEHMGINNNSIIITYSRPNLMGASRVWWMFKYFGHNKIAVLDGGVEKWKRENKPLTNKLPNKKRLKYITSPDKKWLTTYSDIKKNIKNKKFLVVDARNKNRFIGIENEPREGLKRGHIPNSKNIFWDKMITKNGTLIKKNKIKEKFSKLIKYKDKISFSCGSGVSATVLCLSLYHALSIKGSVYDGSWAEWGSIKGATKEK